MECIRLARHAMATRFELVLYGASAAALRAAAEEALDEIDRLEAQLSLFRPTSEIADLNARAAKMPVRVSPPVFALLQRIRRLHEETSGAFDITIAPLLRCWGFLGGSGHMPPAGAVAAARELVGMQFVELDQEASTVRFARPGVMLDLGAVGKGYAIEQAVGLLRDAGVERALLHGGTSTVYGLGTPPDEPAWKVAIDRPPWDPGPSFESSAGQSLFTLELRNQAMSVSAVWGKFFKAGDRAFGHIIDPRTGQPATGTLLSAVVLDSATETDAFSTALLVLGEDRQEFVTHLRPGTRTVVLAEGAGQCTVRESPA